VHVRELGGTRILWNALQGGEIDAYAEYSGTLRYEIAQTERVDSLLASAGLFISEPLGFNNTYAVGVTQRVADSLGLRTISDLAAHPDLVFGLTNEFVDRKDGWPALRDRYGLGRMKARGMDHDLAYRGLASGDIHVTDVYSTDADVSYYTLRLLDDDRHVFPEYKALIVYSQRLHDMVPWQDVLRLMQHSISESAMQSMNADVKIGGRTEAEVAISFLKGKGIEIEQGVEESKWRRILDRTAEHLLLVGVSLGAAILISIPIGIWGAKNKTAGRALISATGIVQVIPSLALLVMLIPVLGIGFRPAIAALFLYSLLPIVRSTQTGILAIGQEIRESAVALGLPSGYILRKIELPIAMPHVISGIKTSTVINIGTATLGALIGAGGYGQPILTGIRLDNTGLILEGALPAVGLALAAQAILSLVERWVRPKGMPVAK